MNKNYPRDMVGYGSKKFTVKWPNNARLASIAAAVVALD